ncbi:phage tail tape measure protein [Escherichia coli]|nr:phage tail tape measure protein [Escherichia coli]EET4408130.1 phage tail tape measure protein [Escherichia coli]EET5564652.1 phage tail tape measure protein [Escherichia coli]EET5606724.1 phage tail tape measure protein [Escherichia coli]EET5612382.1 phage tail tape measure protein [Escherichia coli]
MAADLSISVLIGGAISGAFRSAMGGTRSALTDLGRSTQRLRTQQNALNDALARYGHLGGSVANRLNADLQRVSRTLQQLQNQQARLSASAARSQALRNQRMNLYAQGAETYALARTMSAPFVSSVKTYAGFESGLRDIAVTGNLNDKQEVAIGNAIRQAAGQVNQLQETLLGGVNQLVADGMNPEKAAGMVELLGKTATATKADMTDLAKMTYAFSDALKIGDGKEMEEAFAMAAVGAKTGSFELKDMAKALPTLAKSFAAKGITGPEAIKEIVASLEAAKGSGSAEEAVTNMTNWMAAMTRGDTVKKYEKAGVDYEASMQDYVAKGYSQYEASLMIADRFIKGKGDAFIKQWQEAGASGDGEAQQKLMESFGLSEVFTDIQTVNHLLSMRQNWDKYQSNKAQMSDPGSQNALDTDFGKQNNTLEARWRKSQVAMNEIAISIGSSLRPALVELSESLLPVLDSFSKWLAANPEMVATVAKLLAGFIAFKAATVGCKLALNLMLSPFADCIKAVELLRTRWLFLKVAFSTGGRFHVVTRMLTSLGRSALTLAKILGSGLLRGLMMAGRAVLFLGRALLMNPIGLIITGIAVAAYLIYRYWGPISAFFKRLWAQVTVAFRGAWSGIKGIWSGVTGWFSGIWAQIKTAFSGGIAGVGRLIMNWSPLGLFCKAFAGVMKYFGIDMPKNFTDFGGNLINGLVNGIGNALTAAKETVVNFGNSISGWFKETLGIHSPSQVFAGFGDNIAQGAAIGINRTAPDAISASQQMAAALIPPLPDISVPGLDVAPIPKIAPVTGVIAPQFNPLLSKAAPPAPSAAGMALAGAAGAVLSRPKPLPPVPPKAAAPAVPELPKSNAPAAKGRNASVHVPGQSSGVNVTFAPQITIKGAASATEGEITSALKLSLHELEKMMERIMARRERREYA